MAKNQIVDKLSGLIRLFRFELPFTAGVCVILGEILAASTFPGIREMILGFMAVFLISASALILNDYFDVESDRINAPERPVPSGLVTQNEALYLFILVSLLGFFLGYLIHLQALLVLLLVWLVGVLYNWRLKQFGLLGNLMVSFSVGMTFIFGGVVVNQVSQPAVLFFALWVFLINLGEEIAADANDLVGDRQAGSRSLAVRFGPKTALRLSSGIFLLVVTGSLIPFLLGWLDWIFFLPLALADAVILYAVLHLPTAQESQRRKVIRWIYLSGMAALLVFIAIKIVGILA